MIECPVIVVVKLAFAVDVIISIVPERIVIIMAGLLPSGPVVVTTGGFTGPGPVVVTSEAVVFGTGALLSFIIRYGGNQKDLEVVFSLSALRYDSPNPDIRIKNRNKDKPIFEMKFRIKLINLSDNTRLLKSLADNTLVF